MHPGTIVIEPRGGNPVQTGFRTHTGTTTVPTATRLHPRSAIAAALHLHTTVISGLDDTEVEALCARGLGRAAQTPRTVLRRGHIHHVHHALIATVLRDDPRQTHTFLHQELVVGRPLPTRTIGRFHIDHANDPFHLLEAPDVLRVLGNHRLGDTSTEPTLQLQARARDRTNTPHIAREVAVVVPGVLDPHLHVVGALPHLQGDPRRQDHATPGFRHEEVAPLGIPVADRGHLFDH